MKLLTSSYSSSPSSSSTLSFDPTLCNSKSATAGCLTAILRRILCSGGLQTQPSNTIRELDSMSMASGNVHELKGKQKTEASTTTAPPGIVARLMGLESMGEANPSSLSRSRSMNSVNYLGECKRMQGLHRRVKSSSSSFCEVPTFHLLENENFLVFSFENGGESKEFKSRGSKKETSSAESKQKREERRELEKNKRKKGHVEKENLSRRVSDMSSVNVGNDVKLEFANTLPLFNVSSEKEHMDSEALRFSQPVKRNEVTNAEKVKKRKKGTTCYKEKKVETECSSEDSSPVSVFDFEREASGTEVDSFGVSMSWRRKLSPELENDQLFTLHSNSNLMIEEGKVKAIENNKHEESKKKEKQSQEYVDIWGEICRLAEDELVGSSQLEERTKKQGDFESVSADFESEIFDHLLNELIDQLVENPLKALQLQNL
ncbi:uncharacterized protein LOC133292715 [Gastrolobium bilobum]|uniref:uncharacterized protein LOC133292715 n=1 Tax=Gastrolobium bilobum TaxID=150636 RepID=UPI002AAFFB7D|nr:uncharacterized protein LOC133292715 [Gastrolobium bilobum]